MYNTEILTKELVIETIKAHKERIGTGNDLYQLAHAHIIRLIKESTFQIDLNSIFIEGYRLKDLIVLAERLRREEREPKVVEAANEAFLSGYKMANEDFKRSLDEAIIKIEEGYNG